MKRNDEINHDMLNRLVYRGHDQDRPNVLDYVNKEIKKKMSMCLYCTALDEHERGLGIPFDSDNPSPDKPYIFRVHSTEYMPNIKTKWILIDWIGTHVINYCPMCGRKLDANSKIRIIRGLDYYLEDCQ